MTVNRIIPLWQDQLAPKLKDRKDLLVVGHGNSIRALTKYLEIFLRIKWIQLISQTHNQSNIH